MAFLDTRLRGHDEQVKKSVVLTTDSLVAVQRKPRPRNHAEPGFQDNGEKENIPFKDLLS